ncbi:MAG: hypothetical protein RLZZ584_1418 [Pseudomonadota bacterium]|jgi:hypothetical protein
MKKSFIKLLATAATAIFTLSANAATTQVDISPYTNFNTSTYFYTNLPAGNTTGNAGSPGAGISFNILSQADFPLNVWNGGFGGDQIDIKTSIFGATQVHTLLNTFWVFDQATVATVDFVGTNGAAQTFTLIGNRDIRDYNIGAGGTLGGTLAQSWWNTGYYFDVQTFNLNSSFANQTLTDIVITAAAGSGPGRSMPFLTGVTVESVAAAVPELETLPMMMAGIILLGVASRRRSKSVR